MNCDVLTKDAADGIALTTLGPAKRMYSDTEMGDALTAAQENFANDPKLRVVCDASVKIAGRLAPHNMFGSMTVEEWEQTPRSIPSVTNLRR